MQAHCESEEYWGIKSKLKKKKNNNKNKTSNQRCRETCAFFFLSLTWKEVVRLVLDDERELVFLK